MSLFIPIQMPIGQVTTGPALDLQPHPPPTHALEPFNIHPQPDRPHQPSPGWGILSSSLPLYTSCIPAQARTHTDTYHTHVTHAHVHTDADTHTQTHTRVRRQKTHMHTHMRIHKHSHANTHTHTHTDTGACKNLDTHTIHTRTHTQTHRILLLRVPDLIESGTF